MTPKQNIVQTLFKFDQILNKINNTLSIDMLQMNLDLNRKFLI
jgi:hypothetical protein